MEFPEYKKKVLEILSTLEFDENDKLVGKWQPAVIEGMKVMDKKAAGLAMKFAPFVLD